MIKLICGVMLMVFSKPLFADWSSTDYHNTVIYNYVPETLNNKKRALMLSLHGCDQSGKRMKEDGNWEAVADQWNMIVSVPEATNGGVYVGCWDYFGVDQHIGKPDVNYLVTWIEHLLSNKDLNIDKHQVYISGYSSGGTMAMVIGCLRPDLVAGLAISSAPSIGTKYYQSEYIATNAQKASKLCRSWAGDKAQFLETQTTAMINSNFDIVVRPGYNKVNAEVYRILTTSQLNASNLDLKTLVGYNNKGSGTRWSDNWSIRVVHIINKWIGHKWPTGSGEKKRNHVNGRSVNFPHFLGEYFYMNNRRRR